VSLNYPLSMQLYSARRFPPVEDQLAVIARRGYTNVETFGPFHEDTAATRRLLDAHGLTARSGHFNLDMVENHRDRALDIAGRLGMEHIVVPYLPPEHRPTDRAGWTALGARLAEMSDWYGAQGRRLAWHNHDFEFAALPDGSLPIEHVLGATLPWKADIAWVVRGNADPEYWIERYRGRIPLVHVKDIEPAGRKPDEDGWADVGAGVLPWRDLWARCVSAGAEIMIAEHDNPNDFDRFAKVSAAAMRGYASGGER
jgi:sugar phosphate isomerase/epimerase